MNTHIPSEQPRIAWRALSRHQHDRSRTWYIASGGFALAFLVYSIVTTAWSLTAVIVIGTALYYYTHRAEPETVDARMWDDGIAIGKTFVPWNLCDHFHIVRSGHSGEIVVTCKGTQPNLRIPLGTVSILNVRRLLREHLEEQPEQTESLLDILSRICKI